jgi:hypothetical protein
MRVQNGLHNIANPLIEALKIKTHANDTPAIDNAFPLVHVEKGEAVLLE